jgi:hypothetical protein
MAIFGDAEYLEYTRLLPEGHYIRRMPRNDRDLQVAFNVLAFDGDVLTLPDGRTCDPFDANLNTAIALDSPVLSLAAHLHGQCEIHGWIAPGMRHWFANLIEDGRKRNVLRDSMGWEEVAAFLRGNEDGRVVTSYSVCDGFPNRFVANWEPPPDDPDGDSWYDLSHEERWNLAEAGLNPELEWRSITFNGPLRQFFGNGISGFDINRAVTEKLVAQPRQVAR